MNPISIRSRDPRAPRIPFLRLAAAALALAAAHAPAQQRVTLAVEGNATGADAFGAPSRAVVRLGDAPAVQFALPAGDTPAGVALQLATVCGQLGAVVNLLGSQVEIFTGPGGAPLRDGVSFGSSDIGHTGVVCELAAVGPPTGDKTDGCTLPQLLPGAALGGGMVWIDADVEVQSVAGPMQVRQTVMVPVGIGEPSVTTNQHVLQALRAAGLRAHACRMPSSLIAGAEQECLQLDSDRDGNPVRRCAWRGLVDGAQRFAEVHLGRTPAWGSATYGQPSNVDALGVPLQIDPFPDLPQAGQPLQAVFETRTPQQFCVAMLGFQRAELPFPLFGPGAVLLVDPANALVFAGVADMFGDYRATVVVPPDPQFFGIHLFWTGADLPAGGFAAARLSRGMVTVVR